VPSFVVASLLLMVAAVTKWFPVIGWGTFAHMLLPAFALSLWPMAYIVRLTRASMLDTLGSDFVRTARAKGLSRPVIIWKHCLRNAFLPVLSYIGPATAGALTGSFVVEKVFTIPGLGQHFVNSVQNRDRTLILGVVMVDSFLILVFNLLVDVAYAWVDPRIDISAKAA
jgi:oligopeptide transport system permease protein